MIGKPVHFFMLLMLVVLPTVCIRLFWLWRVNKCYTIQHTTTLFQTWMVRSNPVHLLRYCDHQFLQPHPQPFLFFEINYVMFVDCNNSTSRKLIFEQITAVVQKDITMPELRSYDLSEDQRCGENRLWLANSFSVPCDDPIAPCPSSMIPRAQARALGRISISFWKWRTRKMLWEFSWCPENRVLGSAFCTKGNVAEKLGDHNYVIS